MAKLITVIYAFLFSQNCFSQAITWAEDVACIINTHCIRCHNNTSSLAAIPFTNYQEGYANRNAIKYYVQSKNMPPYMPNTSKQNYTHEKNLMQHEIDLIVGWVNQGSQQGDSTLTPPTPTITPLTSNIARPDFSHRIAAYTVPNIVGFQYHCFVLPTTYSVEKYLSQIEVLPSNTSAVYSAFLYSDTSSIPISLDAADNSNGYENYGGIGSPTAKLLYGWVNGNPLYHPPSNIAIRLDAKAHLVLRILYAEDALGKIDSTQVNLKFDTSGSVRVADVVTLLHHAINLQNPPFIIPADSIKTFYEQQTILSDATLLGISPWTHKLCKSMNCIAVTVANDTINLLQADEHCELWSQGFYYFSHPIKIPAGATLYASAEFDNTSANGDNPFFPPHNIVGGYSDTTESMEFSFMSLPYQTGDETTIADSVIHQLHYLNCASVHTVGISTIEKQNFSLFPNPVSENLSIQFENEISFAEIQLLNVFGKTVMKQDIKNTSSTILNVAEFSNGIYFIQIKSHSTFLTKKFIKH